MRSFAYERPADTARAVEMIAGDTEAKFLGGGTNLVDLMRLGVESPARLVDVTRLGLDRIDETDEGGLLIGASVRNSDLAASPLVRDRLPVLCEAVVAGASGQLRNLATVGGNLLQRTRCLYFQDVTKPCNKREPGTGCPAREGEHRNLAILGHSEHCVATHPSDMAVALAALDARVHVRSVEGSRVLSLLELYRLPGSKPEYDTTLKSGDLITAVEVPALPFARFSAYRKARDRASFAFALVALAAAVELGEDGAVEDVRLALGGVAHMPWRARRAEDTLRGRPASAANFAAAADAELSEARPLAANGYKVTLARNLIVRTLSELAIQ